MKKSLSLLLICVLCFSLLAGCGSDEAETSSKSDVSRVTGITVDVTMDKSLIYYANIEIENYGTIKVELDQDEAPITVENFVELAESGFYDGLTFHRIIKGFMIQGGDPDADGTGGSDKDIVGEFSSNGYDNSIKHERGVISMARANDYNSASSQFFIMHDDADHLDGDYAAFGHVIEGMDIVDSICNSAKPLDGNGTIAFSKQPVINKITITTEKAPEKEENSDEASDETSEENQESEITIDTNLDYYAEIEVEGYGTIGLSLYDNIAPITVNNFVNLSQSGFYDGLTFHRIIEGFMMQGGSPDGTSSQGDAKTIKGEFSKNGVENNISHLRGVISMARTSASYDSASTQFFIVHQDSTALDGEYAAFGKVISGMSVVDAICEGRNGVLAEEEQPVITKITIRTE